MLTIDYANCLTERVGAHGIDPARLDPASETSRGMAAITRALAGSRGTGWERWRELWNDPMRAEHLGAIRPLVDEHKDAHETMVVLGIGGSALGNIAIHGALNPATHNLLPTESRNGPRLFVVDNVDP